MKLRYEDLLKGLEFALNYHGIDAKVSKADFVLAELLAPQVIHGAECYKRGQDPAMTAMLKTTVEYLRVRDVPLDLGKPTDIEVITERLAKVEDTIAAIQSNGLVREMQANHRDVHKRINTVVEIIGERMLALDKTLEELKASTLHTEHGDKVHFDGEPVPTEQLVPQRGDRVRLEGAVSSGGSVIPDGWYDVVGRGPAHGGFQVRTLHDALYWVSDDHPGLKEVRRATA